MSFAPVVIATNGFGTPVVEVENGTPVMLASNGIGMPIVIATNGHGIPVTFATRAQALLETYSPTNGLAFSGEDNSLAIRDSVTPANNYDGPLVSSGVMNRFTFTRASTATFVNSSGVIQSAAIDTPRRDYSTGRAALLIEGAATNLLLRSEEFDNATWSKVSTTVSANTTLAPDGTLTADTIDDGTATALHYLSQTYTLTAATHTFSCFLKAGTQRYAFMDIVDSTDHYAVFDLQTGAIGFTTASVTAAATLVTNGWYRCVITYTTNGSGGSLLVGPTNGSGSLGGYLGANLTTFAWGAQLEISPIATSYIPTTTVAVTRAADVCSIPTSLLPSLLTNVMLYSRSLYTAETHGNIGFDDGSTTNRFESRRDVTSVTSAGVQQASFTYAAAPNVLRKIAVSGKLNLFRVYRDGAQIGADDTLGVMPVAATTLRVGTITGAGNSGSFYITEGAAFPIDPSLAQMANITT